MKDCSNCIPLEGCPNADRIIDPSLADKCVNYLDARFYADVMLPDSPDKPELVNWFVQTVQCSRSVR